MKRFLFTLLSLFLLCALGGCTTGSDNTRKKCDVEFTVLDPEEAPEALTLAIRKKHITPFKLTYLDGDFLYIARGYGTQPSGGYHITVDDVYLTANGLVFKTTLFGPRGEDVISRSKSYPYLIVKVKRFDGCVIFN
ncbi:PrcB C-terminal [Lachnospiraceae bacterium XBB1006]|nr:PrcB C-terminal [Lachnospiraceae bacterium XBB1006]